MSKRGVNSSQLESACARLGDAVVDPKTWPELMDQICRVVGAAGALLLQSDIRTPDVPRTASIDEGVKYYFQNGWHLHDSRAQKGAPLLLRGAPVIVDQDFMTPEQLARDPYYNECMVPIGMPWCAAVGFWAGPALWGLCIQRSAQQGPFAKSELRPLIRLSRRLTEVATLSTAVGRIALSSATSALNLVRQPAIAIDHMGFVVDANAEAESFFDDEIQVRNKRLFIHDKSANRDFDSYLSLLRVTPDTAALPAEPIVVRREEQQPVIIRILPVPCTAKTPFLGARALLTFASMERRAGPNTVLLVKVFGLTPAEARLASIIAEGEDPEGAAESLGISRATVRNQLKAVFAKTSTHRQSELVALLSRV